jgi:membrane dipeptidase
MHLDRRAALFGLAAATAAVSTPARAQPRQPLGVDMLCYGPASERGAFEALRDTGDTAIVLDLGAFPRVYDRAKAELEALNAMESEPSGPIRIVRVSADFERARAERRLPVVLASQDASILGTAFEDFRGRLTEFHGLGLRVLQLTHNQRTPFGDGFMEPRDGGLSMAGAHLVRHMNETGVMVDLSHCSRNTLLDVAEITTKPLLISHAGVHALAPTRRNKTDEEIALVAQSGGVFGVFGLTTWLTNGPDGGGARVLDHIAYVAERFGAQHVGFGSDGLPDRVDAAAETERMGRVQQANAGGPSAEWPVQHTRAAEFNIPGRMTALRTALRRCGFSRGDASAIAGGNFMRVFAASVG